MLLRKFLLAFAVGMGYIGGNTRQSIRRGFSGAADFGQYITLKQAAGKPAELFLKTFSGRRIEIKWNSLWMKCLEASVKTAILWG
jgi:hypothetical protein